MRPHFLMSRNIPSMVRSHAALLRVPIFYLVRRPQRSRWASATGAMRIVASPAVPSTVATASRSAQPPSAVCVRCQTLCCRKPLATRLTMLRRLFATCWALPPQSESRPVCRRAAPSLPANALSFSTSTRPGRDRSQLLSLHHHQIGSRPTRQKHPNPHYLYLNLFQAG